MPINAINRLQHPSASTMVPQVAVATAAAAPLTFAQAMEHALSATLAGTLQWLHKRKKSASQQGKKRLSDTFSATLEDNSVLEITAEHATKDDAPTVLHQWQVRHKQHKADDGRLLDGQYLTLEADTHANLISRLFTAVYDSLESRYSHLYATIASLQKALQQGTIPANVSVIPPSLANPLAGCSTIIQIGDNKNADSDLPVLELTRFAGMTRMTLRHNGDITKIPATALNNAGLRKALNTLVDIVHRQSKVKQGKAR